MSIISKKVQGKLYFLYDKYYTKEEAHLKAKQLRDKAKAQKQKMKTYVEEIKEFGSLAELFIPGIKYYLWIKED